jgi:Arc/MetJ-type ribon-helix-helix transcriptional regulator
MGTTCVAMAVLVPEVFVAYVGDSRIYLLRDNTFYQLTEDHTVVSDMVRKGILTRDQARNHEERNVLSLSMGGRPEITASYWENPMIVRDGDRFLLCSDGLHDLVSDSEMQAIVAASAAHKAVPNLIEAARRAGLVDTEKKDREDLQRRRAALLQGSQTEAIRAQIDELLKDIQDSEARLASAQKTYDELTEKLSNFRTSLTARLVSIRQQQSRLDAYSLDVDAFYEKTRTAAQEICNSKAPDSKQTPPTQGR